MSTSLLLNRTTAPTTLRFFDACFKRGVIDACTYGDDIGTKEFLDKCSSELCFGILGKDDNMDWQAFRYEMYWLARTKKMTNLAESYFFRIRQVNYAWCVLLFCMRFYLMGISEWLSYPSPVNIEIFKSKPKIHWDPCCEMKTFTKQDTISYMHQFEYEYRKMDNSIKPIQDSMLGNFIQSVVDLSRPYAK